MNDSLRTDVYVRYSPESIACSCIWLAARQLKIPLPENPPWYHVFQVTLTDIEVIAASILKLYARKKTKLEELEAEVDIIRKRLQEERLRRKAARALVISEETSRAIVTPKEITSFDSVSRSSTSSKSTTASPAQRKRSNSERRKQSGSSRSKSRSLSRHAYKKAKRTHTHSRSISKSISPSRERYSSRKAKRSHTRSRPISKSRSPSRDRYSSRKAKRSHTRTRSTSKSRSPSRERYSSRKAKRSHTRSRSISKSRSRSRERYSKQKYYRAHSPTATPSHCFSRNGYCYRTVVMSVSRTRSPSPMKDKRSIRRNGSPPPLKENGGYNKYEELDSYYSYAKDHIRYYHLEEYSDKYSKILEKSRNESKYYNNGHYKYHRSIVQG